MSWDISRRASEKTDSSQGTALQPCRNEATNQAAFRRWLRTERTLIGN
jgi:hypothetical protein